MASSLAPSNADRFRIEYSGKVAEMDTSLISRAALAGFLKHAFDAHSLNYLNAPAQAKKLGLQVSESRNPNPVDFTDLILIEAVSGDTTTTVAGTFFGGRPRVVRINDYMVECEASGHILMVENNDAPGTVGMVGTLLGKHQINIANMALSRNVEGGTAVTLINTDSTLTESVLEELRAQPNILAVRAISV
jgi:D-3-phosphoglycerate dehydrogenase